MAINEHQCALRVLMASPWDFGFAPRGNVDLTGATNAANIMIRADDHFQHKHVGGDPWRSSKFTCCPIIINVQNRHACPSCTYPLKCHHCRVMCYCRVDMRKPDTHGQSVTLGALGAGALKATNPMNGNRGNYLSDTSLGGSAGAISQGRRRDGCETVGHGQITYQ